MGVIAVGFRLLAGGDGAELATGETPQRLQISP
jgi:hypothetical protein